ncbi:MAG: homoserine O-succinyltransferase [Parvularculaceae bacterium]
MSTACSQTEETAAARSKVKARKKARAPFARDVSVALDPDWRGDLGGAIADKHLKLRFAGPEGAPVVLALGGISGDRFVADEPGKRGWWADFACAGGGIDLDEFQVAGADFAPLAPDEATPLTPGDYADILHAGLVEAGVDHLHAFVGSSFGGMIALEMARRHPDFVGRIAVLCASHRASPMSAAWRVVQRRIIEFSLLAGEGERGVDLARQLAMTTYRTPEEFNSRFKAADEAGSYLAARGADYAGKMSALRYLTLSAAIDRHDVAPEEISTPALVIGANSDRLVPIADVRELAARLAGLVRLETIPSLFGHDAFLKEAERIRPSLDEFLKERL